MSDTLYARLGGYDAIAAVADDLLIRLRADAQLARFWQHRAEDSIRREKQLLINFLCASAGGLLRRPRHEEFAPRYGDYRERLAAIHPPPRSHARQFRGPHDRARCGAGIYRQHEGRYRGIVGHRRRSGDAPEAAAEEVELIGHINRPSCAA
jgi:hypothetical protein